MVLPHRINDSIYQHTGPIPKKLSSENIKRYLRNTLSMIQLSLGADPVPRRFSDLTHLTKLDTTEAIPNNEFTAPIIL